MPRAARVVAEGVPQPITQRGNNRQDTFLLDEDRRIYLNTIRAKCRQQGVPTAWCASARLLPDDREIGRWVTGTDLGFSPLRCLSVLPFGYTTTA